MRFQDRIRDIITLTVFAVLLLGCYATTHRGPRTIEPGKVSVGGSYMRFSDSDPDDPPGELFGIDGRVGIFKGLDAGFMRTFEISEGVKSGEGIDTYWFDTKLQIANRDNKFNAPTVAIGYGFGKVINYEETWVNTLYFLSGVETKHSTLFYSFRYEFLDEEINFVPSWVLEEEFDSIRKAHIIGLEVKAHDIFRPVIEVGRFIGSSGNGSNVITAGVNIYSK